MSGGRSASYCRRTAVPSRALAQALLDAGQQVLGPARASCRSASRVTRMAWLERIVVAVVEARQVQADHVLQQHEHVPAGASGSGDEARQHLARDVDDRQRAVGQRRGRRRARMEATRHSERLPRYGKGWPGSTASGVSTGSSVRRKYSSRNRCCSSLDLLGAQQHDALGGEQRLDLLAGSSGAARPPARARAPTPRPCVSAGVSPSGPACDRRRGCAASARATRTMKNSSRFELKMARNFTRSSSGTLGSCASSSTRRLNSSHDSSRLTNASASISSPRP